MAKQDEKWAGWLGFGADCSVGRVTKAHSKQCPVDAAAHRIFGGDSGASSDALRVCRNCHIKMDDLFVLLIYCATAGRGGRGCETQSVASARILSTRNA